MATIKTQCFTCDQVMITYICEGCSKEFCSNHLTEHRKILGKQFDEIENDRDQFQQILIEQKQNPNKHSLIQQINKWENNSIEKIKQTANECKQRLIKHTNEIENKLIKLTEQLRDSRKEDEFNEIDLNQFKIKLEKLTKELDQPPNVSIRQNSASFISKISVNLLSESLHNDLIDLSFANIYDCLFDISDTEPTTSQSNDNPFPHADSELVKLFKSVNDQRTRVTDADILTYIREHMDPMEKFYIRNIVLSYLEACLINRDPQKKIQEDIAKKRMTILNAIIDHKPEAEIQAVYAIQNFVHKLEHPPKMARLLFDIFYDEECVNEDAFFEWLKHPDQFETEGHAIVEISTKDFFSWLQQAEREVEEED